MTFEQMLTIAEGQIRTINVKWQLLEKELELQHFWE